MHSTGTFLVCSSKIALKAKFPSQRLVGINVGDRLNETMFFLKDQDKFQNHPRLVKVSLLVSTH